MKIQCFRVHIISSHGLRVEYVVGQEIIFGRADDADIKIDSPKTSRKHFKAWCKNSEIYVEDLGSSKGTTINGKPIKAGKPTRYKVGDTIQVGGLYGFVTITAVPEVEQVLLENNKDKDFERKTVATGLTGHFASWLKDKMNRPGSDGVSDDERELIKQRLSQDAAANAKIEQMYNQARASIRHMEADAKAEVDHSVNEAKKLISSYQSEAEAKLQLEIDKLKSEKEESLQREMTELKINYIAQAEADAQKIRKASQDEQLKMRESMAEKARQLYEEVTKKAHENSQIEAAEIIKNANQEAQNSLDQAAAQVKAYESQKLRLIDDIKKLEIEFTEINSSKDKVVKEIEARGQKIIEQSRADALDEVQKIKSANASEIKTLEQKIIELKEAFKKSQAEQEENEKFTREQSKEVERVKVQLEVLKSEYTKLNAQKEEEYQDWGRKIVAAERECDSLSKDFAELKSEKSELENAIASLAEQKRAEENEAGKLLSSAKSTFEEATKKSEKYIEDARAEAAKLKDLAEKEIALNKVKELEKLRELSLREEKNIHNLRAAQSKELERLLNQQLSSHFAAHKDGAPDGQLSKDISRIVKMVMQNEHLDVSDDIKKFESFDPESAIKSRKYLKKAAISVIAASIALFLAIQYWPTFKKSMSAYFDEKSKEPSAQEVYAKQMRQMHEERAKFNPTMTPEYKDTYTQNVIYTENFVTISLSEIYQKEWILSLNDFFVNQLRLSENAIVPFVAKETNLIKALNDIRGTIHPDYLDDALNRMTELEVRTTIEMTNTVGGDRNWKKFVKFKKNFYKNFDPNRLPANQ